jgi:hypothetical protein
MKFELSPATQQTMKSLVAKIAVLILGMAAVALVSQIFQSMTR